MIWTSCLQIQWVCEVGAAAGLFFWAARWMGCGAFDLLPVRLWTVPRGEALLWGTRAFIFCWQGRVGRAPNAPCSRRHRVCGACWLAQSVVPKFLHTESNVDIKGQQCFNHAGFTTFDSWRFSQSLETRDWFRKVNPVRCLTLKSVLSLCSVSIQCMYYICVGVCAICALNSFARHVHTCRCVCALCVYILYIHICIHCGLMYMFVGLFMWILACAAFLFVWR